MHTRSPILHPVGMPRITGNIMNTDVNQLQPLLLNVNQVAALLGCHRNTAWNRARNQQLPSPIKREGKTVWRRRDIENFVESLCA